MSIFFTAVIAGLTIGSIYGLVGIGYTVAFNSTRVFNLAQGDLVMVGVMASYYALDVLKVPQVVAFFGVVAFVMIVTALEERLIIRPFLGKTGTAHLGWFISTLGFAVAIESVVSAAFGNHAIVGIPSPLSLNGFHVGSVVVGYRKLLVIGTFLVVIVLLEIFYSRTWMGQAMRATAEDRDAASLRGINPVTMSQAAFLMAGFIAAVAGFVIAPLTFSDPTVGINYTLKGFLALVIGGFGSIRGAVAGGLMLGVAEQLFDAKFSSNYEILVGLALVMVVLGIRPEGMFKSSVARTV